MKVRNLIYFLPILIAIISLAAVLKVSYAVSVTINDNAAGSSNQINVNQKNQTTVNQNNSAEVSNDVDVNCNTGANSQGGNTGNCAANVNITNKANTNKVDLECPNCPKPSSSPGPAASPNPNSGGGSGSDSSGGGGDSGGSSGGAGGGQSQVLGATGSANSTLLFLAGFGLIALGLWQFNIALSKRGSA
jgi:hypothetical protein